jgi:probable rRNA maturation factor
MDAQPPSPVDLLVESTLWDEAALAPLAERAVRAALDGAGLGTGEWQVALLACDDARIAGLNAEFRGAARPTNVLSWPSAERAASQPGARPAPPDPTDPELGDVAIAHETCAREAAEQGKPFDDHVTHLIVHAVLHLLGYDHETEADARLMEGEEVRILGGMGLADPYGSH